MREKGRIWVWKVLQPPWPRGGPRYISVSPGLRWGHPAWWPSIPRQLLPCVGRGLPYQASVGTWSTDVFKSHDLLCSLSAPPPQVPTAAPRRPPPPLCHGRLGFLGMGFAACVTNHIARDFQPTLSPASGAAATAFTAEDAARGRAREWAAERPLPPASGLGSRA